MRATAAREAPAREAAPWEAAPWEAASREADARETDTREPEDCPTERALFLVLTGIALVIALLRAKRLLRGTSAEDATTGVVDRLLTPRTARPFAPTLPL
jgi:hypothetical protein